MSHFAKVEYGVVTKVIVADQSFVDAQDGTWVQTSYNTRGGVHYEPDTDTPSQDQSKALRKNYASFGYTYDTTRDAFIPPKPYDSWVLNEDTCLWEPPLSYPTGGGIYAWDELLGAWVPSLGGL